MSVIDEADPRLHRLTLPEGHNSNPELLELYEKALKRQTEASAAWTELMKAHIKHGSDWSAIVHSALASGVSTEEIRSQLDIAPSTLSRWQSGVVKPSRMLRKRLEDELLQFVKLSIKRLRGFKVSQARQRA